MHSPRNLLVPLVLLGIITFDPTTVRAADTKTRVERQRLIRSARRPAPKPEYDIRYQPPALQTMPPQPRPAGIARVTPPPSPGIPIATTWVDAQSFFSQGRGIARNPGSDRASFIWDGRVDFDTTGEWIYRETWYNTYLISSGIFEPGPEGLSLSWSPLLGGGPSTLALQDNDHEDIMIEERYGPDYPNMIWHIWPNNPGEVFHFDTDIGYTSNCSETLVPRLAIEHRPGLWDILHTCFRAGTSCSTQYLYYDRAIDYVWSTPYVIDSTFSMGYIIAVDPTSNDIVIVLHDIADPSFNGANNIVYYRSTTGGDGWISGAELGPTFRNVITNYTDTVAGPQAGRYIDALFDNNGTLHIIWDEQQVANKTANVALRHWSDQRGTIKTVTLGYWDPPAKQNTFNLGNLSLGIGNGSTSCSSGPGGNNNNYLYMLFTKYCGNEPDEQADTSAGGYCNGEIYLTMSATGGDTWTTPANLTQTKTPDCDPATPETECRSDDWANLNMVVSDLDIRYISDHDAGAALYGEGSFQQNDLLYLRLPGGALDAQYLCPVFYPTYSSALTKDIDCEYYAEPGTVNTSTSLTLQNLGDATLSGNISVLTGSPWLSMTGEGDYSIPSGGADLNLPITLNAALLTQGVYNGTIQVTHNDPNVPSPQDYEITFYVIADFQCPQHAIISTGVE